jgi:ABC-type multidrug transport system fused ATPase/permease subunit
LTEALYEQEGGAGRSYRCRQDDDRKFDWPLLRSTKWCRVDNQDVRNYKLKSLRRQMSFVLQETLLFRATVWQNIAYGRPEASRQEILQAAELANADEFIRNMPQQYDTMVGEKGVTLYGGQRQRIAIARAS